MINIAFLIAIAFSIVDGRQFRIWDNKDECICVPITQCKLLREHENLIDFQAFTNESETECGSLLMKCCTRKDIIPEESIYPQDNGCGYKNTNNLAFTMLNANDKSQYAEFPWMIKISEKTKRFFSKSTINYLAGGSLIHPSVVLTAAHKVYGKHARNLIVRGGEWDKNSDDEPFTYQDRKVSKIITHESFNENTLTNGIALLFLNHPMNIQRHVNTICLPSQNFNLNNNFKCTVTGWGVDDTKDHRTSHREILKKIDVPLIMDDDCNTLLRNTSLGSQINIDPSFLCAGGEAGKGICTGDGGSPLVCHRNSEDAREKYFQAGIVVGGMGCGEENKPGLYIKITNFVDWIEAKIANKFFNAGYQHY